MLKPVTLLLTVLVLVLPLATRADDRLVTEGPDLSSVPKVTLPATPKLQPETNQALIRIAATAPELARKIRKKLTNSRNINERTVYLLQRLVKINELIDYSELTYKKNLSDKENFYLNADLLRELIIVIETEGNYSELQIKKKGAAGKKILDQINKLVGKWLKKYFPYRAERRKILGLHEKVGKTEPPKPIKNKPKAPGPKNSNKNCSDGSLIGGMDCVEVLIDE